MKMRKIKDLYFRYQEIFIYLVAGILTTLVSIISYQIFRFFHIYYMVATVFSWICAVMFAYVVNKKYVFKSSYKGKKEFLNFIKYRLLTLFFEMVFMFLLVDFFHIEDRFSKILVQFIVVVFNYIFSKLFVFQK